MTKQLHLAEKKLQVHCPADLFTDDQCDVLFEILDLIDLTSIVKESLDEAHFPAELVSQLSFSEE